ncbi:MAG: DUF1385 domain-containing protein [Chloroflexi bacterium]|nr:DUF1385 domain-containing protein [Chloroflexota bacterium]
MFRGERCFAVAVRSPSGEIVSATRPLPTTHRRCQGIPFLRGLALLLEAIVLGVWSIWLSEKLAKGEARSQDPFLVIGARAVIGLAFAAVLFLLLPQVLMELALPALSTPLARGMAEGGLRLGVLLVYVALLSRAAPIRRVMAYHGAEHKVGQAFQKGAPLEVAGVRAFSRFHPWCGTSLLIVVVVIATALFPLLSRVSVAWGFAARLLLLPLLAAASFELTLLGARPGGGALGRLLAYPGLWLQHLTTREPGDMELEVAIHALTETLRGDGG